jgi:solute carrier family 25 folate transporter 32
MTTSLHSSKAKYNNNGNNNGNNNNIDILLKHLIAGVSGGLASTAVLYPLELIKIRMQVIDSKDRGAYKNINSSIRYIYSRQGIHGFYRGLSPAIVASSGSWGGYFYFYELSKKRKLKNNNSNKDFNSKLGVFDHLTSGVEAGAILVCLFNPIWLVKTRLALQDDVVVNKITNKYSGIIDTLKTIVKEEGVLGLYKGIVPALLLTSHGAIQFASYEWLKSANIRYIQSKQISKKKGLDNSNMLDNKDTIQDQHPIVSMLIGGTSKIVASVVTYPYQVIKSRLQQRDEVVEMANNKHQFKPKYKGFLDCFVKIWNFEGVPGFFRGIFPNLAKVAPGAGVTFLVYEEVMKGLHKIDR